VTAKATGTFACFGTTGNAPAVEVGFELAGTAVPFGCGLFT
jgi:hypothetical protein